MELEAKWAVRLSVEEYASLWDRVERDNPELLNLLKNVDRQNDEEMRHVGSNLVNFIMLLIESGEIDEGEGLKAFQAGEIARNMLRLAERHDPNLKFF